MTLSPINIPTLIMEPLRYFFSSYTTSSNFVWDPDEKKRTVDIAHFNDFFRVALEERPRILVDRGSFSVSKVGLTDNLAEAKTLQETRGLKDRINMLLYSGTASILVEARQMGTCELLADIVGHALQWSRPEICNTLGFKSFADSVNVSPCQIVDKENVEKFQVALQFPWQREEHWRVRDDGIILKNILLNMTR